MVGAERLPDPARGRAVALAVSRVDRVQWPAWASLGQLGHRIGEMLAADVDDVGAWFELCLSG